MSTLLPAPRIQFIDENGEPLEGGKVYTYTAGTTTNKTTWKGQGESVANTNPIILDSEGKGDIWGNGSYKIVVKTSADITVSTTDSVNLYNPVDWTGLTASVADLN